MKAVELVQSPPKKKKKKKNLKKLVFVFYAYRKGEESCMGQTGQQQVIEASAVLKDAVIVEKCYRPYILRSKGITKPLDQASSQDTSKDTENLQTRKRTPRLCGSKTLPTVCIVCIQSKRKSFYRH